MNIQRYNRVFTDLFNVSEEELGEDFLFGKVNEWDSFAHMELIAQIEDTFEIILDANDITHFGGYENGKKILSKYGIEF